jgi:DNA-binding NtrC family response regulator
VDLDAAGEQARGGVLFLDEVAGLSSSAQTTALKLLDDAPPGASADVRIVASSAHDLAAGVAAGRFRADLFYRLSVLELRVPPLRERREDILPLARAALARIAARLDRPVPALSHRLERLLAGYAWPGNLTELTSSMERLMILTPPGQEPSSDALPERLRHQLDLEGTTERP